jgi:Kdo2-lipid IVA lauroyltransferase/acyltransferase
MASPPIRRADLRLGETWSPLQRAKNDALWAAASFVLAATRPLPVTALRLLGRLLGSTAHAFASRSRRIALTNVARVFPDLADGQRRDLVRRCFGTLGELLGETVALLHSKRSLAPLRLSRQALDLFARARAEGRGVVFASAHLGPWEQVAASLVAAGVPLVALARESYDPRFSRLYEQLRSAQGVQTVWRASSGAAAGIVRTLRRGGVLGIPMDLRARVDSCEVPFLGHVAPTAIGPARLALRLGSAVIVGTVSVAEPPDPVAKPPTAFEGPPTRELEDLVAPGGGAIVTATRIATGDLPPGRAGILELTRRINFELSHRILAFPHAWVWMHERWPAQTGV